MLSNFIFSLNVVLPSFIMIFIGWFAKKRNVVKKEMMDEIGKITFTYFLSSRIFLDIIDSNIDLKKDQFMTMYCVLATIITYIIIWILAWKFMKRKESVGAFIQACFRSSFTVLGLSTIRNLAGDEGVARCATLLVAIVIMYNVLAVLALTKSKSQGLKFDRTNTKELVKSTMKKLATNPLIIAAIFGVIFAAYNFEIHFLFKKPIQYLGDLAIPLPLLCIGASLDTSNVRRSFKYSVVAAVTKTVLLAIIVVPVAVLIGFRGFELSVVAILFTTANPSASYVMSIAMDNDGDLAATSILLSTMFSVVTVTIALYILKSTALI